MPHINRQPHRRATRSDTRRGNAASVARWTPVGATQASPAPCHHGVTVLKHRPKPNRTRYASRATRSRARARRVIPSPRGISSLLVLSAPMGEPSFSDYGTSVPTFNQGLAIENLSPASLPDALLALPGTRAAPVGMQADRERPGRHVGLTPDIPDSGRDPRPTLPRSTA